MFKELAFSLGECNPGQLTPSVTPLGYKRKIDREQKYINASETECSIPNRFQQFSVLVILERYFFDWTGHAIMQLLVALSVYLAISFLQY